GRGPGPGGGRRAGGRGGLEAGLRGRGGGGGLQAGEGPAPQGDGAHRGRVPGAGRPGLVGGPRPPPPACTVRPRTYTSGVVCPACGLALPAYARFCARCGSPLAAASRRAELAPVWVQALLWVGAGALLWVAAT